CRIGPTRFRHGGMAGRAYHLTVIPGRATIVARGRESIPKWIPFPRTKTCSPGMTIWGSSRPVFARPGTTKRARESDFLSEQVPGFRADEVAATAVARTRNPPDDRDGYTVGFAHHQFRRGGQLVGHRNDRCLQQFPIGITLAAIVDQGRNTSDAERDIDEAFAPGA